MMTKTNDEFKVGNDDEEYYVSMTLRQPQIRIEQNRHLDKTSMV